MKYPVYWIILAGLIAIIGLPLIAAADSSGTDQGWYVIHANVQGADVYFDNTYVGTIGAETFSVPASTTGTPYKKILIWKDGYAPYSDSLPAAPGSGNTTNIYVTLTQYPVSVPTIAGVEEGWYLVRCNVEGATVSFDGVNEGVITQGVLYVEAPIGNASFKEYTVEKDGYTSYTGQITRAPLNGETIDLYSTLNPAPVSTTPETVGGSIGWFTVQSNVDGASVSFDNDLKGQISQGSLTVQVYTTATPYKTFTVFKEGYLPYTGTISQYPAEGETVYLNATLNPVPVTTNSPVPLEIPVLAIVVGGICTIAFRKSHR